MVYFLEIRGFRRGVPGASAGREFVALAHVAYVAVSWNLKPGTLETRPKRIALQTFLQKNRSRFSDFTAYK